MSAMAEHYHVRRRHLSSTGSEDYEDERLDPRIQVELEKLNKASEEINRLELELDDARASFRQTLSESTQKLDILAKKLGSCVEKARPYYDARVKAKEAHLETQRAALRFERACSMHEAAKEMVQLAEQGYRRREQPSDPAWQEMLNHATMKVNEAEKERIESEQEHQRTMIRFKISEDQVQGLQKELKRAITKSKPYFEMKSKFNQIMEEHKHKVSVLEEDVSSAKSLYSTALRSLEAISDEIHHQRMERRQQQQLGVRGAGVGAESPLPPPSWDKGHSVEGRDSFYTGSCQALDPLGVIKISSVTSYSGSATRRSRNLSGESNHGKDQGFVETRPEDAVPVPASGLDLSVSAGTSAEVEVSATMSAAQISTTTTVVTTSVPVEEGVYIPADPLGVLPPIYTSSGVILSVSSSGYPGGVISHPVFSGQAPGSRSSTHVTSVTHPMVSHIASSGAASQFRAPDGGRSKSESTVPEKFIPPSAIYPNPEKARRESYRRAVERYSGEYALPEDIDESEIGDVYMQLPRSHASQGSSEDTVVRSSCDSFASQMSRQRSYSNPVEVSSSYNGQRATVTQSNPIPVQVSTAAQEALADEQKHGSVPERSATHQQHLQAGETGSQNGSPAGGSPSTRRSQKLQGLILRVDASMDPMYPAHAAGTSRATPPQARSKLVTSPSPVHPEAGKDARPKPNTDASNNLQKLPVNSTVTSPEPKNHANFPTKPIMRSSSNVSAAGSERSETELSEVESVSATQSPTKARSRLLKVPSSMDMAEDSSDTESLASTGPMLDDEQVEFLNMDFSDALERLKDEDQCGSYPMFLRRTNWSRMSLPPRLSHLEGYLLQAKRMSGDLNSPDTNATDSPTEEERAELREIMQDLREETGEGASEPDSGSSHEGEEKDAAEEEENVTAGDKENMIVIRM